MIEMDVNKLKKINQLTATLRKHGLAACTDDATEIASRINAGSDDSTFKEFISHKEPFEDSACEQAEQGDVPSHNDDGDNNMEKQKGLSEERIVNILQSFSDQFCEEINQLRKQIEKQDAVIKELSLNYKQPSAAGDSCGAASEDSIVVDELISADEGPGMNEQVAVQQQAPAQQMQQTLVESQPASVQASAQSLNAQNQQASTVQEPAQQTVKQSAPVRNTDSPRSGGFNSNDVAIEKFFYFGTK